MKIQKAYFLLPSTDIAPDTLVRLGQVVPTIKQPHRRLNGSHKILQDVSTTAKTDVVFDSSDSNAYSVGLLAQFLAQLGSPLSGGVGVSTSSSSSSLWKIDRVETHFFEPDNEYINALVHDTNVNQILSKSKLSSVYVITGIKIARGASCARSVSSANDTALQLLVDTTTFTGAPMSTGLQLGVRVSEKETETWGSSSDFVWAVRYRRISLNFFSSRPIAKDVYGGQLLGIDTEASSSSDDSDDEEEQDEERTVKDFEVNDHDVGLDYTPRGFDKSTTVDEDGEECVALV